MKYIKEITVDLAGEMFFEYITAVQGDTNSRFVKVTLLSNAQPYNVPSDATAVIRCKKPDGTNIFNDATINEDGTITAELTEQMLAAVGNCKCEISLYGADESSLTSVPFIVKVTSAAVNPNITSTDEYTALTAALNRVNNVSGVANSALEAATKALNDLETIENDIDEHTAAATAATESANTAAAAAQAVVNQASKLITRYGVSFGGTANTGATVARLYNAVGLVAGVGTDTTTAKNDFDNIYPWSARRRCCGTFDTNGNFIVNAYKGEPGYTEDGSNGEVWVEHSLFFYKHTYSDDGAEEIVISASQLADFFPAPIFIKPDGTLRQKAYTAAYPMATIDGKATSRAGVFSDLYSLNTAMTAARTLGDKYTVTTTAEWYTECLYMWVEFATRNIQSVMVGAANMPYVASDTATVAEDNTNRIIVTNAVAAKYVIGQTILIGTSLGSYNKANNRIVTAIEVYDADNKAIVFDGDAVNIAVGNIVCTAAWKNGSCNSVLTSSGSPVSNTDGKHNCVYRGKETPYANSFEWISDILFNRQGAGTAEDPYKYDIHFLSNPTLYAAGTITDDYTKLNFALPIIDGYVKKLGFDSRFPWLRIPSEVGASSTTYYSDYYIYPRYALCAARVGGNWNGGSGAGPCCWNCGSTPSTTSVHSRARLSYYRT